MRRWLGLASALAVGIGGMDAISAQDLSRFDGQYMGQLTLTRTIGGDCTEPPLGALYPLTISGGQVRFTYLPRFATTLTGQIAPNGTFKASARVKNGVVQMSGRIQGTVLSADIVSPSCNYSFHVKN